MVTLPNKKIIDVLLPAYAPCKNFDICAEATWHPSHGHIPRGFLGATESLESVEVVFVFAEPGYPHNNEKYDPNLKPIELLQGAVTHAYNCFKSGKDSFHRNARFVMDQIWPGKNFDEQLKYVWLTESRLCSIKDETGNIKMERHCAHMYLKKQINLLPQAIVVAFGQKARNRLKSVIPDVIDAHALAPPGSNLKSARPSWEQAISEIQARRR